MKFRKKPVEVEAVPYDGTASARSEIQRWMNGEEYRRSSVRTRDIAPLFIDTLEGRMEAQPGDWIIKGVQGEFYPCKPDIFEESYDPVGHEAYMAMSSEYRKKVQDEMADKVRRRQEELRDADRS